MPGPDRVHVSDFAFTGAVPAVHGTGVTYQKEDPVRIAVSDAIAWAVFVFGQRVCKFVMFDNQFFWGRECLLEDRVVFVIVYIDKREVVGGNAERELINRLFELYLFIRREFYAEKLLERIDIPDPVPDLPPPVFPVFGGILRFLRLLEQCRIAMGLCALVISFQDRDHVFNSIFYLPAQVPDRILMIVHEIVLPGSLRCVGGCCHVV